MSNYIFHIKKILQRVRRQRRVRIVTMLNYRSLMWVTFERLGMLVTRVPTSLVPLAIPILCSLSYYQRRNQVDDRTVTATAVLCHRYSINYARNYPWTFYSRSTSDVRFTATCTEYFNNGPTLPVILSSIADSRWKLLAIHSGG